LDLRHDLNGVLRTSRFEIMPGVYGYATVSEYPSPDKCFVISTDRDEITVVAQVEQLDRQQVIERHPEDFGLIALHVAVPFYDPGFLASITSALAKRGLNVLIVSTFSKDYVLVRVDRVSVASDALLELGLHEVQVHQLR